jgi:hypothetical protein
VNLVYGAEGSAHSIWYPHEQWVVRLALQKNSAIRASTANFHRRRALARTGKPVNEQDLWALDHCSHGAFHFTGPSEGIGYTATVLASMPLNRIISVSLA